MTLYASELARQRTYQRPDLLNVHVKTASPALLVANVADVENVHTPLICW